MSVRASTMTMSRGQPALRSESDADQNISSDSDPYLFPLAHWRQFNVSWLPPRLLSAATLDLACFRRQMKQSNRHPNITRNSNLYLPPSPPSCTKTSTVRTKSKPIQSRHHHLTAPAFHFFFLQNKDASTNICRGSVRFNSCSTFVKMALRKT